MFCNILLLGQTGVGKSSLLNYLAGETLAESGISSGIGGITRGINKYNVIINGQKCQVSDSEGLELNREKAWRKLVDKELFAKKSRDSLSSWYHIVVFCIGSNSRVQDFELNLIDEIIENKYSVIIALTKADLATEEELSTIISDIKDHFEDPSQLLFIPVCSKQRRNNSTEGKEELCEAIINSWELTLLNRLPEHVFSFLYDSLSDWYDSTTAWLSTQKIGLFHKSKNDVLKELNSKIEGETNKINNRIKARQKSAFKDISGINNALGQALSLSSLNGAKSSLSPRLEKLESSFVFKEKTGKNIAIASGLAAVSFFLPAVGALAALGYTVGRSLFGTSPSDELQYSLTYQYKTLVKAYSESEIMYEYLLADSLGYYYGTREVAIGYLKGRGLGKNSKLFSEKIKEVEKRISEYEIEDGRGEYYLAYYYYSSYSGNSAKSLTKGKKWLKLSVSHKYPDAVAVNQFGDVYARMLEQEKQEEEELINYWYGD